MQITEISTIPNLCKYQKNEKTHTLHKKHSAHICKLHINNNNLNTLGLCGKYMIIYFDQFWPQKTHTQTHKKQVILWDLHVHLHCNENGFNSTSMNEVSRGQVCGVTRSHGPGRRSVAHSGWYSRKQEVI